MPKRLVPIIAVWLLAASAAHAQYGGGGMGGGMGGGHGGHGGRGGHERAPPSGSSAPTTPPTAAKPVSGVQIIGVIKAIDPASGRVTIAYDDVPELHWPAGTMPFVVAKSALLKDTSVGEKIRFSLESQQISSLAPY